MFDLGPHAGFIVASYVVATVVLAALIGQSLVRYRAAKRQLDNVQGTNTDGERNG